MTRDQEDDMIGEFTQEAWKLWVEKGWLEGIQKECGTLDGKRELAIFESAWKLGFAHSVGVGRDFASRIAQRN